MIAFFKTDSVVYPVECSFPITEEVVSKLSWLFGNAQYDDAQQITGLFKGPRKEMITPWSTNAVEITQNMGIKGIKRIEIFQKIKLEDADKYDPMLEQVYNELTQDIY